MATEFKTFNEVASSERSDSNLHKEELPGRIISDASDRSNIKSMSSTCIHPLRDISQHSDKGVVNDVTGKIYLQSNTTDAVELGRNQLVDFQKEAKTAFNAPISRKVKLLQDESKKSHPKVSAPTVDNMLAKSFGL